MFIKTELLHNYRVASDLCCINRSLLLWSCVWTRTIRIGINRSCDITNSFQCISKLAGKIRSIHCTRVHPRAAVKVHCRRAGQLSSRAKCSAPVCGHRAIYIGCTESKLTTAHIIACSLGVPFATPSASAQHIRYMRTQRSTIDKLYTPPVFIYN